MLFLRWLRLRLSLLLLLRLSLLLLLSGLLLLGLLLSTLLLLRRLTVAGEEDQRRSALVIVLSLRDLGGVDVVKGVVGSVALGSGAARLSVAVSVRGSLGTVTSGTVGL